MPDAALSTSTPGVSIATSVQGAKEWTVGSAIQPGTLTSANDTVAIGGTLAVQVTGAADLDHWQEAGNSGDTADSLTYTWSGPGSFTGTGAAVTWTAPATAGTYTLTCAIDDVGAIPSGDAGERDDTAPAAITATVYVIGGEFTNTNTDQELRYYCGAGSIGWQDTCTAPAQPPGTTFTWTTTLNVNIFAGQGTNQIHIEGIGPTGVGAQGSEWIAVQYQRNGVNATSNRSGWTVRQPMELYRVSTEDTIWGNGYKTLIEYALWDQYGDPLDAVPYHEEFGTFYSAPAYQGIEDWNAPSVSNGITPATGTIVDGIGSTGVYIPMPSNPSWPSLGTDLVQFGAQTWFAGSASANFGCPVQTGTMKFFRDHGELTVP